MPAGVSQETKAVFNNSTSSTRVVNGQPITRTSSDVIQGNVVSGSTVIRRSHNNNTRKVVSTGVSSNSVRYVGQPQTVYTESNPKRYVNTTTSHSNPKTSYIRKSTEVPRQSIEKTYVREEPKVTVVKGEPRVVRTTPGQVSYVKSEPQVVEYKKEPEVRESNGVLELLQRYRYDKVSLKNYNTINNFSQEEVSIAIF